MVSAFLSRRAGGRRSNWQDWLVYAYLVLGVVVVLGPVLWAAVSSLKSPDSIIQYPPELVPQTQATAVLEGYDKPLPLYDVTLADGEERRLAQVSRVGIQARMVDPDNPGEIITVSPGVAISIPSCIN